MNIESSLTHIAIGTGLIVMIPAVMTQISEEWNWSLLDFVVIVILLGMLWLYVELAVGLFTNWGS